MMKYNLGATSISTWNGTATNAGDLGLFYQWGRKDPFVGAAGWTNATFIQTTYTSPYVRNIKNNTDAIVSGYSGADATIQYSILNPTSFICPTSATINDWLNVMAYTAERDNLWGNPNTSGANPNPSIGSKSIYDPCPPGWRVPPQDAFTRFTTTGSSTNTLAQFNVINSNMSANKGYDCYYAANGSGSTSYYPACGSISLSNGNPLGVLSEGHYWLSTSYPGSNVAARLFFFSNGFYPSITNYRGLGCLLRCAQE